MVRIPVVVRGSLGEANYLGLVDTGSTYVILPERDCVNLGLARDEKRRKVSILTVKGETAADLYSALSVSVVDSDLLIKNVEILAKTVHGMPCILGMSFMRQFDWSFSKEKQEFTIC
jgi:clan AA aspartic protease (TIGR02281 family)